MNVSTLHLPIHLRFSRTTQAVAVLSVVLFAALAHSDPKPDASLTPTESPEKRTQNIPDLIAKLSDDSYSVRQKASADLWKQGLAALPALRKAVMSQDPEVSARASELILYISSGVLFDSPEEIKKLVLKFSHSNAARKLVILRQLGAKGHWRQVLHLAKREKDPAMRKKMADIVQATATRAVRDAIAKGDLDLADKILKLNAGSPSTMLTRAWFLRYRGGLNEALKKAKHQTGKNAALWRMALYRADGNLAAVIREADQAGENPLADSLRVLQGNPLPWLQRNASERKLTTIYRQSCRIQIARLTGKYKQADILARELASLAFDDEELAYVPVCLASNGYRKLAVDLMLKKDKVSAFDYFSGVESPQRALAAFGISPDAKPPFLTWVKKFTQEALEQDEDDSGSYIELLMLASFLEERGESEHALAVLTPMMSALEKSGSDAWFDLIAIMSQTLDSREPNYGLAQQAIHFIEKRGNEDNEADLGVKKLLQGTPAKSRSYIWDLLKTRNNQDLTKALHELALLSGLTEDPDHETEKLQQTLLDEAKAKDANTLEICRSALYSFAIKRNDILAALALADVLAKSNILKWGKTQVALNASLLRWGKVEPAYAAQAKEYPGDYYNLTQWFISLRKLGRKKEAKKIQQRAMMLSLGDPEILLQFSDMLQSAGYEQDALALRIHAAIVSKANSTDYQRALMDIAGSPASFRNNKQWKIAASITEVNLQQIIRGRSTASLLRFLRERFYADFFHGMHLLQRGRKQSAMIKLRAAHNVIPGAGILADDFFPALRHARLGKQYDQWFAESYHHVNAACKLYPRAHNTHNTAAWLASKAVRKLDAAYTHSKIALKFRPHQSAYIDTMAEICFARGNRKKAIEWSQKAVKESISHAQGYPRSLSAVFFNYRELTKQLHRFKKDPLPKRSL